MLISFIYELLLWVFALLSIPKLIYCWFVKKRYRESLRSRLGFDFPPIEKGDRKLIWIHAVSVGEAKGVAVLAKKLKTLPGNPLLLISSVTETGHAEAKRSIPEADYHVYMPFDFYGIIAPIVKRVKPDLVLLCETDFWYHFMRVAKQQGAYIALVNGKISEKSLERFKRASFFVKPLFALFDVLCLQGDLYAERFGELGIPPEKMVVTGNLKFDSQPNILTEDEKVALKVELGIHENDKVVVIGSTHSPEEKLLLDAIVPLWQEIPSLKVIVVPRHPERFEAVAALMNTYGLSFMRYSERKVLTPSSTAPSLILLDAMGVLGKCYQVADVAIVAGSYTPTVGGHNILEPLWFGVPLIYGPYMHTQPDLVQAVSSYNAGLQLPIDNVAEALRSLVTEEHAVAALRQASLELIAAMHGSTNRSYEAIVKGFYGRH